MLRERMSTAVNPGVFLLPPTRFKDLRYSFIGVLLDMGLAAALVILRLVQRLYTIT